MALKNLNPLVHKGGDHDGLLATLSWDQVKSTVIESISLAGGREDVEKNKVFGPQRLGLASPGATDEGKVKEFKKHTDGLGPPNLALVFLGVDETETSGSSMPGELIKGDASSPAGIPYFALSLTYRPPTTPVEQKLPTQQLLEKLEESGDYDFVDTRALAKAGLWETHHAALVAQARSLIDWNERNVVSSFDGKLAARGWCGTARSKPCTWPRSRLLLAPAVVDGPEPRHAIRGQHHQTSTFTIPTILNWR